MQEGVANLALLEVQKVLDIGLNGNNGFIDGADLGGEGALKLLAGCGGGTHGCGADKVHDGLGAGEVDFPVEERAARKLTRIGLPRACGEEFEGGRSFLPKTVETLPSSPPTISRFHFSGRNIVSVTLPGITSRSERATMPRSVGSGLPRVLTDQYSRVVALAGVTRSTTSSAPG